MTVLIENFDPKALASQLYNLRLAGKRALTAEFIHPNDLRNGMEAQKMLSAAEGITTDAWKVAVSPDDQPVLAMLHPYVEAGSDTKVNWLPGMKLEVEIAVRLGKGLPIRRDNEYSRTEILESIAEIYLGAELLWSCIVEGGKISFPLYLADRIGNQGYVVGPALPRSILDTSEGIALGIGQNGQSIYDAMGKHPKGDILTWLVNYANYSQRLENSLGANALITTGSLCGAIELASAGEIDITANNSVKFNFSLIERFS